MAGYLSILNKITLKTQTMKAQFVKHCTPNQGILVWNPNLFERIANQPNRWVREENMKRVKFYPGKRYSYIPSKEYCVALAAAKGLIKRKIANLILND